MDKKLVAEPRSEFGKNVVRRLRKEGYVPAVVYSHGNSVTIKFKEKEFFKLFRGNISESVIFELSVAGQDEESMAFVKDYQLDPVTDSLTHVDFFKVTKGEKIQTTVPIEVVGVAKGIKLGGVVDISEREIEVECLPKDLPEKIVVDITELLVDDSIHAKDVELGEGVVLKSNPEGVIAACNPPKAVVEEEELEETEELEGEASEEETSEEE